MSAMAAESETMGVKGRCVRCKEWQEHYYWEHMDVSNISFIRTMTADCQQRVVICLFISSSLLDYLLLLFSFIDRLSIPENIANKFTGQIAFTLKAPSGDTWCVDVGKIGAELYFTSGWEEFAKAHELRENDLLLFKCSGSASFDVLIFDSGGSVKVPCFFSDKEYANMRRQFDDIVPQQAEGNRPSIDSDNAIVPLSPPVGSPQKASTSGKRSKSQKITLHRKEDESPNNGDSQVKGGVTGEEEQSDDEHIDSDDYYYSRFAGYLTADEREQIFGLASIQPGNPVYVVVLQKAHVRRSNNILTIPRKFEANHLERKSHDMLFLRPNRKEQWTIKYYHATVNRGFNGSRWVKFVRDNGLREGDVCVFELIKGARKATMMVHVTRKVDSQFVLMG
ncbi:unnamed protein product [Alopecurus aequalis]